MTNFQQAEDAAKRYGFGSYRGYLDSPHWAELRHKKLARGRICAACGSNFVIQVHHVNYRNLIDVSLEDLVLLCQACHEEFHTACIFFKADYAGMSALVIREVLDSYRKTDHCAKRQAKLNKKKKSPDVIRKE